MTTYSKNPPRIIFLGDGSVGTLLRSEMNEYGNYNFYWKSIFIKSLFPYEIKNIPPYLVTYRPPIQGLPMPSGGVFLVNTSSCGRDFVRANLEAGQQKIILALKKQYDIMNSGLLFLLDNYKFSIPLEVFVKLQEQLSNLLQVNHSLHGEDFKKYALKNDLDKYMNRHISMGNGDKIDPVPINSLSNHIKTYESNMNVKTGAINLLSNRRTR